MFGQVSPAAVHPNPLNPQQPDACAWRCRLGGRDKRQGQGRELAISSIIRFEKPCRPHKTAGGGMNLPRKYMDHLLFFGGGNCKPFSRETGSGISQRQLSVT